MTPTPTDKADGMVRAARTVLQGIVAAVLVAVLPVLLDVVAKAESFSDVDWGAAFDRAAIVAITAALMAVLAYVQRAMVDPRRA